MSSSSSSPVCCKFSIKEIEETTNHFDKSRILGEGAEAKVYRAEMHISSNKTPVAVKHYQYENKEFEMEVQTFSKIQHPNIVSLLGYCNESGHQVLVYEYMENGCLSDYLKKSNPTPLSWLKRLSICLDVAQGLQYIHTPSAQFSKGIVHRDVKPGNILLDKNWVGKLSDFGIIKLSEADQEKSQMATTIKGTSGYFAPEYHRLRLVTRKIDVFSFGVVLFRVLCRKSPWDREDESYFPSDSDDLGLWAQQNIDPQIREGISVDSLNLYTGIIGKSLKSDPHKRPFMCDIVLNLQKALEFQKSAHSQKLTELPELPVEGITIPRFNPESSRKFSIKEIEEATNHFDKSRILGEGAEAKVYRAEIYISSKKTPVAIKHYQNKTKEFELQIQTFSKIQHPNIVSVLGYCNESGHQVLVYEYMANGSLYDYFKKSNHTPLSWLKRLSICLDVAQALQYIHSPTAQFSKGIVHRGDVRLGNILLDEKWVGKLSDVEIIKVSEADQEKSQITTTIKGTSGYFAPEYYRLRVVTRIIDVSSFGVVLLRVLCRKSPWDREDESYYPSDSEDIGLWAQQNIDPQIREGISVDSLNLYTGIIGKSLKSDPRIQPSMREIVLNLQQALEFQKSPHSQKLIKLPDPESSRQFSVEHIETALLGLSATSGELFSVDELKAALFSFSKFKRFSLDEIKSVTNQFDNSKIIGQGQSTTTYSAEIFIDSNKFPVVVKQLKPHFIESQFKKLIPTLFKIQHPNFVPLIGYCIESGYHILVYQYMAKGCLDDYLKEENPISSSWIQRINICLDVAQGIQYLHTATNEFPKGIVYRGLKPSKIVVDENWVGKLSDSTMYKVSVDGQDISMMMASNLIGTSGYYAPEYIKYRLVTRKLDVYTFGVVLFKVLCRKMMWDRNADEDYYYDEEEDFGLRAKKNVDVKIKGEISGDCLAVYTDIIGRCLKTDPAKRPTMEEVVMDLEKAIRFQNSYSKKKLISNFY